MNSVMTLNWDFWCDVAGIIAIVGPILLIFWYAKAVKVKLKKLNQKE